MQACECASAGQALAPPAAGRQRSPGKAQRGPHREEPLPGTRPNGLAHGAQDAQAAQVVGGDPLVLQRLQAPDQRGRCVQRPHLHPRPAHVSCCTGSPHAGLQVQPLAQVPQLEYCTGVGWSAELLQRATRLAEHCPAWASLQLVDDVPDAPCIRVDRHALKDDVGRPAQEGPVRQVAARQQPLARACQAPGRSSSGLCRQQAAAGRPAPNNTLLPRLPDC